MAFSKTVLAPMTMPYALGATTVDGVPCVLAATEDRGPVVIARPPYRNAELFVDGPGGCMSLLDDPRRPGEPLAVMGCFVGYHFQGGGIYRLIASGTPGLRTAERLLPLPFGHRLDRVERSHGTFLIAAVLAANKESPADWNEPGAIYAAPFDGGDPGDLVPVLDGIHRNHGLARSIIGGRDTLLASGDEGLFALDLASAGWEWKLVLARPVSEMVVYDVDGDGSDELLTIEPFHGNALCLYRLVAGAWTFSWQGTLEYGHGLWAGRLAGLPSVLVANRSGERDLKLFRFGGGLDEPAVAIVDEGSATANLLVGTFGGEELIFATNQALGEVVVYRP